MKTVKYFFVSFLVVMLLCVSVLAIGQVVDPEPALSSKEKIFGFFKDIDGLNILLIVLSTFFGGAWWMIRTKLKQVGELFIKVYEYTAEESAGKKKLTQEERADIVARVLAIFARSTVSINKSKLVK
jgi:hypothetical protein